MHWIPVIFAFVFLWENSTAKTINITMLANCVDIPLHYSEAQIEVKDIKYESNKDGYIDTIHGVYSVRKQLDSKGTELIITSYSCAPTVVGTCKDNPIEFVEQMDCERYHGDDVGPWTMFANSMHVSNKCAENLGDFEFVGAVMKWDYIKNYLAADLGRYRLRLLAHKVGENREVMHYRGCVELDFDILA